LVFAGLAGVTRVQAAALLPQPGSSTEIAMYAALPVLVVAILLAINWFAQYLKRRDSMGAAALWVMHKKPLIYGM
jgi:hypothetical protein